MVLDLPGGLFGQDDVRETNVVTSNLTGTLYWSATGASFHEDDSAETFARNNAIFDATDGTSGQQMAVHLPHGAVVTGVIVYGSSASSTWLLSRSVISSGSSTVTMASGNHNTEDTTISNATIDNSLYAYWLLHTNIDGAGADIYGARITYTLN